VLGKEETLVKNPTRERAKNRFVEGIKTVFESEHKIVVDANDLF
jgi:hypothetical protein